MMQGDALLRPYRAGQAKQPGYLDDYAYFAQGLVELHRATGDERWLTLAKQLAEGLLKDFRDETNGGFYFTTTAHEDLLGRSKIIGGGGNIPNAGRAGAGLLPDVGGLTRARRYRTAGTRA